MPTTAPGEILAEVNPDDLPDAAPPAAANYREADIRGISCNFCTKFRYMGEKDGLSVGICDLYEAAVQGDHVSDGFADPMPALDREGNSVYTEYSNTERVLNELHFAGSDLEKQDNGLFRKAILRTGEWLFTPGTKGVAKKPLKIVRDGMSDPANGVIAMQEIVDNFKAGALPYVPLTLTEDDKEHPDTKAKLTRYAKGFIRDLFIQDENGVAKLIADIDVTEPDVREKIERGTLADVSSGIPFGVTRKKDGKVFGAVLEHVTLTNNPFIDELGPFGIAASDDGEPVEVANYQEQTEGEGEVTPPAEDESEVAEPEAEEVEGEDTTAPSMTFGEILTAANEALVTQHALSSDYLVTDVSPDGTLTVTNSVADTSWTVPYTITDRTVVPAAVSEWTIEEKEGQPEPIAASDTAPRQLSELEQARQLRELRLSQPSGTDNGGTEMTPTGIPALDGLELSDEASAAVQSVLQENARLRAQTREAAADSRVNELKEAGFENRPGFLKLYRQIMLSDDGGPAAVLLSDDGTQEERVTALDILDRAVTALQGSEGKVVFSDQAISSGNDNPPPATAEGENEIPVEERVAAIKTELGVK